MKTSDASNWIEMELYDISRDIIEKSGKLKEPVALVFSGSGDYREFTEPEPDGIFIHDGRNYPCHGSSLTYEAQLKSLLDDLGYRPARSFGAVHDGNPAIVFEFRQK